MSVRIEIIPTDEASKLLKQAGNLRGRMLQPMARSLYLGGQELLGYAIKTNFTGKGPFPIDEHKLGVVTGRLRRSLRTTQPLVNAGTGDLSIDMGSNVEYFEDHEFGFKGRVQVRGFTRRNLAKPTFVRGKLSKKSTKQLKASLANRHFNQKGAAATSSVRPFTRQVNMPARRPLGTAIESVEGRSIIRGRLRRTMYSLIYLKPETSS